MAAAFIHSVGFCGIDESVDPIVLSTLSARYPFIEWGFLFRPDKEGEPRYATMSYVEGKLQKEVKRSNGSLRLAGHLCGERVNEVLRGDSAFVSKLKKLGE